ncbi:hypothetical protein QOL99_06025 [Deinococcus sp. MIMF12]|uniref:Uncharacterized protein n=1 Tax=Deinococcus rhizophilus TaxID=3049544 RepID=A0ABT7JF68_9DEIO|nr:hypothetical protein [Deinococcus rhizophilus]MDL2343707.1 hypothetical protein [Deinococcus rhizophilus]
MSSPEIALLRALRERDPSTLAPAALAGVERWARELLPLRVTPGDGVEVWRPPPGLPGGWFTARTMLSGCAELWPDQARRRLASHQVHSRSGRGELFWRAGMGLPPSALAGVLLALHLEQVRGQPRGRRARTD